MASKRRMTQAEAAQGYRIDELHSDAQPFAPYHNPRTGKVHPRLPADPWSVKHYGQRGLRLGIPDGFAAAQPQAEQPEAKGELTEFLLEKLVKLEAEMEQLRGTKVEDATEQPQPEEPERPVQLQLL